MSHGAQLIRAYSLLAMKEALESMHLTKRVDCVEWIQKNVRLVDIGTRAKGPIVLDPYQVEPLRELGKEGESDVTVVAVEQIGKSEIWRCYFLYRQAVDPCSAVIMYENEDKAADTNKEFIIPRMKEIKKLGRELARPGSHRGNCFHFSDSITHYVGAGSPVTSMAYEVAIGDEVDFWVALTGENSSNKKTQRARNVSNLKNLKKRTRTYRGKRKFIKVSSPTRPDGEIWQEFEKSSRGFWCLSCLDCGHLSRSSNASLLQWELDDAGEPIESSIRWVCPECGAAFTEDKAQALNAGGKYVHKFPERKARGYQVGMLACPRAMSWLEIAEAQMRASDRGSLEDQKYFDNSIRGLPLQPRKRRKVTPDAFKKMCVGLPDPDDIKGILFSADTQDNGWFCIHRAIDDAGNMPGIRGVFAETRAEVIAAYNWEWNGIRALAGIVDAGGHRATSDVMPMVWGTPGLYAYKGDSSVKDLAGWKLSPNPKMRKKLILANPYFWQETLLWTLYTHTDDAVGAWTLPELDPEDKPVGYHADYLAHMAAMKPNARKRFGHEYRNWESFGEADHSFDAEKMWFVILAYALARLPAKYWLGGTMPKYHIEKLKAEAKRRKRNK